MYNILGDDTNNVHSPTTAKLSLSYNSVPLVELKLHHLNPLGARIQNPVSHLHGCKTHICFDVSFMLFLRVGVSCLYRLLNSTVSLMIGW
jgi:hypothetical protein